MNSTVIISIFSNYLNINTRNLRQLNGAENKSALGRGHKTFSRFREHNLGTMDITLITIFVLKDTILKTLKGDCITNISKSIIILERNDFNSSRRNIERNISTLNYKNLTIYIILFLRNDNITISINYLTTLCGSTRCIINTCKEILVSTECMSLNNLSHLTWIKCKRNRARNINLTTNFNIFGKIIRSTGSRTTATLSRVLQNKIPILWRGCEKRDSFIIATRKKLLALGVKTNKFIRLRKRGLGRSDMAKNITLSAVKNISVFIDRKNKVFLHHIFTHIFKIYLSFYFL